MEISIQKAESLKTKPDDDKLGFGTLFTDHMFSMDFHPDKGWHSPRIEPYGPIPMDPGHHGASLRTGRIRGPESLSMRRRPGCSSVPAR